MFYNHQQLAFLKSGERLKTFKIPFPKMEIGLHDHWVDLPKLEIGLHDRWVDLPKLEIYRLKIMSMDSVRY